MKQLFIRSILLGFFSLSLPTVTMEPPEDRRPEQLQVQVLLPHTTQRTTLTQEYARLFLDEWQQLMLQGNNDQARLLSEQQEKDFSNDMNMRQDVNCALHVKLYRQSQHRNLVKTDERFTAAYFRIYSANTKECVEKEQENIDALKKALKQRQNEIKDLKDLQRISPPQRDQLLKKISRMRDDCVKSAKLIRGMLLGSRVQSVINSSDRDKILETLNHTLTDFESFIQLLTQHNEEDSTKLVKMLTERREVLLQALSAASSTLRKYQEENPDVDLYPLQDEFRLSFFTPPLSCFNLLKDWVTSDKDETLSPDDLARLQSLEMNFKAFEEDTQNKIDYFNSRIAFIQQHPEFFQIQPRSRAELLGIKDVEEWHVFQPKLKLGQGVIVGVVDVFDNCEQTSKILTKATNPDFIGKGCFTHVGGAIEPNHGVHVAGIIVSDEIDKTDPQSMTVGVAPLAQFEMIDTKTNKPNVVPTQYIVTDQTEWSIERMSLSMTQLIESGVCPDLGINEDSFMGNPLLTSQAHLFNWSVSTSGLKRFERGWLSSFEGKNNLVWVKVLQTKLMVQAMGNDGVELSTTDQYRFKKALALNPLTSRRLILTTNLMQDGLTLNPSSNVPGGAAYLQDRTLSAPGTDIYSSLLQSTPDSDAYGQMSGTSMSAPHVTGVAAVLLSNHPHLTSTDLAKCLLEGATPILISSEGVVRELPNLMAIEIGKAFHAKPAATFIYIGMERILREDWERGKSLYGQGRVNLENSLKLASEIEDMT